jgi:hypothetical protein
MHKAYGAGNSLYMHMHAVPTMYCTTMASTYCHCHNVNGEQAVCCPPPLSPTRLLARVVRDRIYTYVFALIPYPHECMMIHHKFFLR